MSELLYTQNNVCLIPFSSEEEIPPPRLLFLTNKISTPVSCLYTVHSLDARIYTCALSSGAPHWLGIGCAPPTHTSTPSPLKKTQSGTVPAERGGLHSIFILHTAAHSPGDYADLNWYLSTCAKASAITLRSSNTPPAPPLHPLSTVSLQTLEQLV